MKPPTVIRFKDVHKSFGSHKILKGLTFDVDKGRTLAIMGPSGIGKSVTLRHIIGLLQPDSGLVEVEGHDMSQIPRAQIVEMRKRMGFVFQGGALINWMTVEDNLALPLRENTDLDETEILRRVHEKLDWVHIGDAAHKFPSELSGGMKKRAGLARALINDPDIILYDEPNAGLDPEIATAINHVICELKQNLNVTSIVVEHRIPCVKAVADEVIFLDEGRAILRETPARFFSSDHPRLIRFLGDQRDISIPT
jgi:phospholipid/cholesterol/gamma-HCH transport system ATP-binding protein